MNNKKNQYQKIKTHRTVINQCSDCGLKSKSVNKSIKYNNYYCIDCLIQKAIDDPK